MPLAPHPAADASAFSVIFTHDFDAMSGITVAGGDDGDPSLGDKSFGGAAPWRLGSADPDRRPVPAIEPVSVSAPAVDLEAVRHAAFEAGREVAAKEASAVRAAETARMIAWIASSLSRSEAEFREIAEGAALSVARTILSAVSAALPHACRLHGPDEIMALARTVLADLSHVPRIVVRVSAGDAASLHEVMEGLDSDVAKRIELVETAAMGPGDLRIAWEDGCVERDAGAVQAAVIEALAGFGISGHIAS